MQLHEAVIQYLKIKNKQAIWCAGEEYSSLVWNQDNKVAKPTEKQLEDAYEDYLREFESKEYQRKRAEEYPPIQEQLDMLYNFGIDGFREQIRTIKNKYPKQQGVVEKKPVLKEEEAMATVKENIQDLSDSMVKMKTNIQNTDKLVIELNDSINAIKGFLMIIPELQKSIDEIKESITNNK